MNWALSVISNLTFPYDSMALHTQYCHQKQYKMKSNYCHATNNNNNKKYLSSKYGKELNITRRVNNKNIVLISAHIYSVSVYKMNHTFSVKYVLQNGECLQNIVIFDESYM